MLVAIFLQQMGTQERHIYFDYVLMIKPENLTRVAHTWGHSDLWPPNFKVIKSFRCILDLKWQSVPDLKNFPQSVPKTSHLQQEMDKHNLTLIFDYQNLISSSMSLFEVFIWRNSLFPRYWIQNNCVAVQSTHGQPENMGTLPLLSAQRHETEVSWNKV